MLGSRWMAGLRDDVPLREVRIPQAHDAATGHIDAKAPATYAIPRGLPVGPTIGWAKTQNLTIPQQLEAGVRSIDLRVRIAKDGTASLHHGPIYVRGYTPADAMHDIAHFLCANPSEVVVLVLVLSGEKRHFPNFVRRKLPPGRIVARRGTRDDWTVGRLRGQVLVFPDCTPPLGRSIVSYYKTFRNADCVGKRDTIVHTFDRLREHYLPCFPLAEDEGKVFVTQLHTQTNLPTMLRTRGGVRALAKPFNLAALAWLGGVMPEQRLNVLEFDFWEEHFLTTVLRLNLRFSK